MREEDSIQYAVADYLKFQYPDVFFTISPIMKCSVAMGVKMKRMGYTKGTPDLMILEPCGGYHGLMIELKINTGKPSKNQKEVLANLALKGYYSAVCRGTDEAVIKIKEYMSRV